MIVLGSGHTFQGEINGAEKIRPSFTKLHCKEVWPSDWVLTCEKCHVVIMAPCVEWRFSRVCCFSLCPRTWRFNWGNIVILSCVAPAVAQPSLSNLVCIALSKERTDEGEGEQCRSSTFSVCILNTFFVFGGTWNNNESWCKHSAVLRLKLQKNTFNRI